MRPSLRTTPATFRAVGLRSVGVALPELVLAIGVVAVLVALGGTQSTSSTATATVPSSIQADADAFHAQVKLARLAWTRSRQGNATIDLPGYGNGTLDVNASGYPVATRLVAGDTIDSIMSHGRCADVFNALSPNSRSSTALAAAGAAHADYVAIGTGNLCIYRAKALNPSDATAIFMFDISSGELWHTDPSGMRRHIQCPSGARAYHNSVGDPPSYCAA